jgi:hypothetical protein
VIAEGDLAVGLGHAEPVAVLAEIIQRFLREIAGDRILVELAVDAGQCAVDASREMMEGILLGLGQGFLEQGDGFRVIVKIVV